MFKGQSLIPHQKNNNVKYPKRQINRQSCGYLDMQEPGRNRKWPLMDARFLLGWWKGSRTDSDSVAWLYENTRSHSAIYSTHVNCTVRSSTLIQLLKNYVTAYPTRSLHLSYLTHSLILNKVTVLHCLLCMWVSTAHTCRNPLSGASSFLLLRSSNIWPQVTRLGKSNLAHWPSLLGFVLLRWAWQHRMESQYSESWRRLGWVTVRDGATAAAQWQYLSNMHKILSLILSIETWGKRRFDVMFCLATSKEKKF